MLAYTFLLLLYKRAGGGESNAVNCKKERRSAKERTTTTKSGLSFLLSYILKCDILTPRGGGSGGGETERGKVVERRRAERNILC